MKLIADEKLISRLQLAGSIGMVIVLVVGLGLFFIRQHMVEYEAGIQLLETEQIQQQQKLLVNQVGAAKDYLSFMRSRTESVLKTTIREQVDQAYDLTAALYRRETGRHSDAEVASLIVEALRPLRFFDGRGYFFIDDLDGNCVLLPIGPTREGTSLLDNRDDTGHPIMRGLIDAARAPIGDGFSRYRWYSPGNPKQMADKIAYVRLFKPLGWIIGTGEYVSNVEQALQQDALERLRSFRFGKSGYIWAVDDNARVLVSPASPKSEGHTPDELSEAEQRIIQLVLTQSAQSDGFVRYEFPRPGSTTPVPKIVYVSRMADWGWTLAAGAYLDDIEAAAGERRAALDRSVRDKVAMTLLVLSFGMAIAILARLFFTRLLKGLIGRYKDDLKRQNETLRETTRKLFLVNFLVDNSAEMIFLTDNEGRLTYANTCAFQRLGWQHEEIIGHTLADFTAIIDGTEIGDAAYRRFEANLRIKGDGQLLVEMGIKELPYDGHLYRFAIARDITERKRWEADLARNSADLQRSNADLESFAYVVSHDLRQPLRMVSSFLSLLERRLGSGLDADCSEFLNFARDGATRMDRMIIDLLEYSRVGRVGKPLTEVPLAEVVETARLISSITLEEVGGTITLPTDLPVVWGNPDELTRLFQNLIGNSIKYRSPNRPLQITLDCRAEDDHWLFSISDNGIGIDPEFHQRVFGLFQRLHGSEYEGTGIGLAVCRKTVEGHGGRIWLESEADKGATFLFTLPRLATPVLDGTEAEAEAEAKT